MTERYFVTGTDTEVGKTVASSALLQAAQKLGKNTAGYKPVASGSEMTAEGLRNTDALALQRNSTDRKRVLLGQTVDLGGRRLIKNNTTLKLAAHCLFLFA